MVGPLCRQHDVGLHQSCVPAAQRTRVCTLLQAVLLQEGAQLGDLLVKALVEVHAWAGGGKHRADTVGPLGRCRWPNVARLTGSCAPLCTAMPSATVTRPCPATAHLPGPAAWADRAHTAHTLVGPLLRRLPCRSCSQATAGAPGITTTRVPTCRWLPAEKCSGHNPAKPPCIPAAARVGCNARHPTGPLAPGGAALRRHVQCILQPLHLLLLAQQLRLQLVVQALHELGWRGAAGGCEWSMEDG